LNRLPRQTERKVLELHFDGVSRDAIAEKLGISSGAVSDILSILPSSLEELRSLSKELRTEDMIIRDTRQGVAILKDLKELGIKPEQFALSIQAITRMASDAGFKPGTVVQAETRIVELETQSGKNYKETTKDFEDLIQQNKTLHDKNWQLQTEIKENKQKVKRTFEAANEAPEEISKFKKQREKLAENGISLKHVETIHNLLTSIEETQNNPKQMVELVKRVGPLRRASIDLQSRNTKITRESAILKAKNEIAEQTLSKKQKQIEDIDRQIQLNQAILDSQDYQIAVRNSQLWQIENNYRRIDDLREAAIIQAAKIVGMSDSEITDILLNAQMHLIEDAIVNRMNLITRKSAAEALARYMTT